ncbi:MAG: 16S rRNA (cytosine(1402)-N(4))-methyltransferase RsmH [Clostridiales Family XIII bacterium]|jgi:16S rRNA (cytosine1402-N4)-methyltransferase|nr:16S rRNA (cytosine(1402)-N(4))-methyltransferase RsmH [Clostridiales Family XIII bacterium]
MNYDHTSVLLNEAVDGLALREGAVICDGTIGGGGHALAIAEKIGAKGTLIGMDKDGEALSAAAKRIESGLPRKIFFQGNFTEIAQALSANGIDGLDGAILDLGVSSKQLDDPARGFSYMQDGPLSMRMNGGERDGELTAADVVNGYSEQDLYGIIRDYGEERWAKRIAAFIVKERKIAPILTTARLTGVIKNAIPAAARRDGPHPAKRTFQAIRIEVNDELGSLERGLAAFAEVLKPKGRLAVITFHSLEDRIVKEFFLKREDPCECPKGLPVCVCGKVADGRRVNRKPILPTEEEISRNPRSRSAKLRILEKL